MTEDNSARLSFANPEDMLKYLDIEPGAVSIMGLMNDKEHAVQLLIDEDVFERRFEISSMCLHFKSKDENGRCDREISSSNRA